MNAPSSVKALRDRMLALLARVSWLPPLPARVTVGLVFLMTGWGKLHNLERVTAFFTSLHLPAPHFQAVLVACTEFGCGVLLLAGLATRLAAVPPIIIMIVAILTAKKAEIHGLTDLVGLEEFTYIVLFVWLAVAGPGMVSLDRLIARAWDSKRSRQGADS